MGGCADVLEHSRERHVRDFRSGRRPRRVGHVRGRCGAMVSALTDTRRGWRNLRAAERRSFRRHRQTRSRYVGARAPPAAVDTPPTLQPQQSRDWPVDVPALLFGATRRARGWQSDAIPVWLEYQYVDAPNPAARGPQLRIGFVSPTTGTGMQLTLREDEERTFEFNQRVSWGTTSLPPLFIDLPTAVRKARENGMQGTLGRARLAVHHPPGAPEILAWMISPSAGEGRTVEGTSGAIIDFDVTGYIAAYNAQWEEAARRLQGMLRMLAPQGSGSSPVDLWPAASEPGSSGGGDAAPPGPTRQEDAVRTRLFREPGGLQPAAQRRVRHAAERTVQLLTFAPGARVARVGLADLRVHARPCRCSAAASCSDDGSAASRARCGPRLRDLAIRLRRRPERRRHAREDQWAAHAHRRRHAGRLCVPDEHGDLAADSGGRARTGRLLRQQAERAMRGFGRASRSKPPRPSSRRWCSASGSRNRTPTSGPSTRSRS